MTGQVYAINRIRRMVGITTDGGAYTVVKIHGDADISLGDQMEWAGDPRAGKAVYDNRTKNARVWVSVQIHDVPDTHLRQQLLL
jgi:hypothetical protein